MNKFFLSSLAVLLIILSSCTEGKKETVAVEEPIEEEVVVQPEELKAPEKKQLPEPKIDTLHLEGTLVKYSNTDIEGESGVVIEVDGEEIEFNYPTDDKDEFRQALGNNVLVTYFDKVTNSEFDIQINGMTIHNGGEFEPTEDAPIKWYKVEGVLSATALSNGVPQPITITSEDGPHTIINSYVHQSHLDNNGKVVTAYYGKEQQHHAISITVTEQVTYHSPFLGVWGTVSPIIIAASGAEGNYNEKNGYYMYFGQDAGFVKADVKADSITGTNFSGKFTIKLISTDPPQFLYSDDGRGHFEPIVDQLHKKVVSENARLLVGKWQSKDDPKSVMEYTVHELIDYYDEQLIDKEPYCLSPKCMNSAEVDLPPSSKHDYISVIDNDMCWYIVSIDENNLTLSFMGRGNDLKYKRIQ